MDRRIINIDDVPLEETGDGKAFVARVGRAGPLIGSQDLGCTLTVVPPGKRAWPFHRHHVIAELFYVLAGQGECRIGEQHHAIRAGDLISAPAGTEPHQIVNTGTAELRYLALSTMGSVDVIDYPDSGKVAVGAGVKGGNLARATIKFLGRVTPAGYFDDETPR